MAVAELCLNEGPKWQRTESDIETHRTGCNKG
jgi:hypothetical protein